MNRIATIILLFVMSICYANAQNNAEKLSQEMSEKCKNIKTINCKFTQERYTSILTEKNIKKGVFEYEKTDNLKLTFENGDYIRIDKDSFEIKSEESTTKTKVASNPMLKNLSSILTACMIGDLSKINKDFIIKEQEEEKQWRIILQPKRGKAVSRIKEIILDFDRKDMTLSKMRMQEKKGDYTEYIFIDKIINYNNE